MAQHLCNLIGSLHIAVRSLKDYGYTVRAHYVEGSSKTLWAVTNELQKAFALKIEQFSAVALCASGKYFS